MALPRLVLKPGRHTSLLRFHPWLFESAFVETPRDIGPGATVAVHSDQGEFMGLGAYSPKSRIRCRMWTFGEKPEIAREFFEQRVERAVSLRSRMNIASNSFRLVNRFVRS